jgi:hypothetical protein
MITCKLFDSLLCFISKIEILNKLFLIIYFTRYTCDGFN